MKDASGERRAYGAFFESYPEYHTTLALDALRVSEYGRLDRDGHVYLDYTGGSLYAECQVREHAELLAANVFGNPHSGSLNSVATTDLVERTRRRILLSLQRAARRLHRRVHAERNGCPQARWRVVSVRTIRARATARAATVSGRRRQLSPDRSRQGRTARLRSRFSVLVSRFVFRFGSGFAAPFVHPTRTLT